MPLDFERLQNIVDMAALGKPADMQAAVNDALSDRVMEVMPYARAQVAANMFGDPEEPAWPDGEEADDLPELPEDDFDVDDEDLEYDDGEFEDADVDFDNDLDDGDLDDQ